MPYIEPDFWIVHVWLIDSFRRYGHRYKSCTGSTAPEADNDGQSPLNFTPIIHRFRRWPLKPLGRIASSTHKIIVD